MEMKEFRKITIEELEMILKNHKLWLDTHGAEGEQACLSYMDLTGVNLENADLYMANLIGTNLQGANLENKDLRAVDFTWADLSNANISGANLSYAIMDGADLSGANMRYSRFIYASLANADMSMSDLQGAIFTAANLRGANLTCSYMSCAYLRSANLEGANLTNADLKDANINHVDLYNANLTGVKNLPDISMSCPATGSFIGWKRADNNFIVKLEIPEDAKRSSAIGSRKCRCNKATVLAIENKDGTSADVTEVCSDYDSDFIYKVGETVEEKMFDENRFRECSTGIHFFMTREEAAQYLRKHILIHGVNVIRASLT